MSYTCLACGKEVPTGYSADKCPVCGFPIMGVAQSSPEISSQMKEAAQDYIKSKVGDYAVGIESYQYVFKEGKIQLEKTIETEIAGYGKLMSCDILWGDKAYKGIDSNKPVHLKVYVKKNGGDKKTCTVSIIPPTGMSVTYIGVKRDGVSAKIVWGNNETYTISETFKLM